MPTAFDNTTKITTISSSSKVPFRVYSKPIYSKKWLGNKDASNITSKQTNTTIDTGSLNPLAITKKEDNSVKDALCRVRAGGYVNHFTKYKHKIY
jgi:hypothetical protein